MITVILNFLLFLMVRMSGTRLLSGIVLRRKIIYFPLLLFRMEQVSAPMLGYLHTSKPGVEGQLSSQNLAQEIYWIYRGHVHQVCLLLHKYLMTWVM